MDKLEKEIEAYLKESFEKLGCLCLKFVSPGNAGVPDRIVIIPGGEVMFIELKMTGKPLRPLQNVWRQKLLDRAQNYCLVDSMEKADWVINYVSIQIPKCFREKWGGDAE